MEFVMTFYQQHEGNTVKYIYTLFKDQFGHSWILLPTKGHSYHMNIYDNFVLYWMTSSVMWKQVKMLWLLTDKN